MITQIRMGTSIPWTDYGIHLFLFNDIPLLFSKHTHGRCIFPLFNSLLELDCQGGFSVGISVLGLSVALHIAKRPTETNYETSDSRPSPDGGQ